MGFPIRDPYASRQTSLIDNSSIGAAALVLIFIVPAHVRPRE